MSGGLNAGAGRKQVQDISGLCSGGAAHHLCRGEWTTPSVDVTCRCECHVRRVIVAKGRKVVPVPKVLVKKSR